MWSLRCEWGEGNDEYSVHSSLQLRSLGVCVSMFLKSSSLNPFHITISVQSLLKFKLTNLHVWTARMAVML